MKLVDMVAIHLALIHASVCRQYGGRGVSRRREPMAAKMIAEEIAHGIRKSFSFAETDEAAANAEIEAALLSVPDQIAYEFADKLAIIAHPARNEIAARIANALAAKWSVTYTPVEMPLHTTHPS